MRASLARRIAALPVLALPAATLPAASLAVLTVLAGSGAPAAASQVASPTPIGHRQYFEGMVNKHVPHASINVVCGGPATTGHPGKGQTVEVAMVVPPITPYQGYTGRTASHIGAWLSWSGSSSAAVVHIATFAKYDVAMEIPTSIKVPCSGKGRMTFAPIPASKSARKAFVRVTFKSKGV